MCGITGIYYTSQQKTVDKKILTDMTRVLSHRGPDDEGYHIQNSIGLGHRRLSIIDLSPMGHQPMCNEDESIWIVFNGEIYNYIELIPELQERGHVFRSHSDTEVIIHAYEEYGEDCLKKFNGMWAFAIWDEKKQRLFCARDRFGVKPFYYHFQNGIFSFASEIKALVALPWIKKTPNYQTIYDYLVYAYQDHTTQTFFHDIIQLPPSHYLLLSKDRPLVIQRYWDVQEGEQRYDSYENYLERFHSLFKDSIKLRLRSDVATGTCLSGGLDSSAIVCTVNELLRENNLQNIGDMQKTFSACFAEKAIDERPYIEAVLRKTGAEKNYTFPDSEALLHVLDKIIYHQDEPFGSTSIIAQWHVMEIAQKRGIKVLLDGQGGDELLGGYFDFFGSYTAELLRSFQLLKFVHEVVAFHQLHPSVRFQILSSFFIYFMPKNVTNWLIRSAKRDGSTFLSENFVKHHRSFPQRSKKFKNVFKDHLYHTLTGGGLQALLHYEDRNSMAFSIEARVPFLDYRLTEYMFSIPDEFRIKDGVTKVILRKALRTTLPDEIIHRHDKIGFSTPEYRWFRNPKVQEMFSSIFLSKSFRQREIFNTDAILQLFKSQVQIESNKQRISSSTIWRWVNTELWFRKFMD